MYLQLENANWSLGMESVSIWLGTGWGRRSDYKLTGKRGNFWEGGHFITLIVVVVSQLYTYVKIYKIVCLKCSLLYDNYASIKLFF